MAYCSISDIKRHAGISGTGDDVLLQQKIDQATAKMDAYCKRTLVSTSDTTRYFTVGVDTDGYWLYFDELCASITTILNGDASNTEVTSSQYVARDRNHPPYWGVKILSSAGKVWEYDQDPEDAIQVTGRWSYFSATSLPDGAPDDIRDACVVWATYLYRQKDSSADIERPIVMENGMTILPPGIPKQVAETLAPYVRRGR